MGYSDRKAGTVLGQNTYVTFLLFRKTTQFSTLFSSFYFMLDSENWKRF